MKNKYGWDKLSHAMEQMSEAVSEIGSGLFSSSTELNIESTNGHVEITGDIKSLKINGKTIRVKEGFPR